MIDKQIDKQFLMKSNNLLDNQHTAVDYCFTIYKNVFMK